MTKAQSTYVTILVVASRILVFLAGVVATAIVFHVLIPALCRFIVAKQWSNAIGAGVVTMLGLVIAALLFTTTTHSRAKDK